MNILSNKSVYYEKIAPEFNENRSAFKACNEALFKAVRPLHICEIRPLFFIVEEFEGKTTIVAFTTTRRSTKKRRLYKPCKNGNKLQSTTIIEIKASFS